MIGYGIIFSVSFPTLPCILAGLTALHGFKPEEHRKMFDELRKPELYEMCKSPTKEDKLIDMFVTDGPGIYPPFFIEWKLYFDHFFATKKF